MRMFSVGGGFGLGVKDFRVVFVFHTQHAHENFLKSGWDFSGQADAAASLVTRAPLKKVQPQSLAAFRSTSLPKQVWRYMRRFRVKSKSSRELTDGPQLPVGGTGRRMSKRTSG